MSLQDAKAHIEDMKPQLETLCGEHPIEQHEIAGGQAPKTMPTQQDETTLITNTIQPQLSPLEPQKSQEACYLTDDDDTTRADEEGDEPPPLGQGEPEVDTEDDAKYLSNGGDGNGEGSDDPTPMTMGGSDMGAVSFDSIIIDERNGYRMWQHQKRKTSKYSDGSGATITSGGGGGKRTKYDSGAQSQPHNRHYKHQTRHRRRSMDHDSQEEKQRSGGSGEGSNEPSLPQQVAMVGDVGSDDPGQKSKQLRIPSGIATMDTLTNQTILDPSTAIRNLVNIAKISQEEDQRNNNNQHTITTTTTYTARNVVREEREYPCKTASIQPPPPVTVRSSQRRPMTSNGHGMHVHGGPVISAGEAMATHDLNNLAATATTATLKNTNKPICSHEYDGTIVGGKSSKPLRAQTTGGHQQQQRPGPSSYHLPHSNTDELHTSASNLISIHNYYTVAQHKFLAQMQEIMKVAVATAAEDNKKRRLQSRTGSRTDLAAISRAFSTALEVVNSIAMAHGPAAAAAVALGDLTTQPSQSQPVPNPPPPPRGPPPIAPFPMLTPLPVPLQVDLLTINEQTMPIYNKSSSHLAVPSFIFPFKPHMLTMAVGKEKDDEVNHKHAPRDGH